MAKKNKTKRAAARKGAQRKPRKPVPQLRSTLFTRDFRVFLTKDPKGKFGPTSWPWPQNQPMSGSLTDVADVVQFLGDVLTNSKPSLPGTGSFIDQVAARVAAFPWPNNPIYQKGSFAKRVVAIHLFEIDRVADMMLEGIWRRGGGGGSRWPPSR